MMHRKILVALFLLLSTPVWAQISLSEVNSAPHKKVEAVLAESHPTALYAYAARLFQEGKKDDAVFWFYAGQLRYRYLIAANPEIPEDQDPALMASLNDNLGQAINEWAGAHPVVWVKAMDRALEWDESHDNPITPKKDHEAALQGVRSGLEELRDTVVAHSNEISQERKAARRRKR